MNNRFLVYTHTIDGEVVYVGHGSGDRYRAKTQCRTKEHKDSWDNLEFIIVKDNLTKTEALTLEQELIDQYWSSGLLFNKRRVVVLTKYLSYDYLSKNFLISEKSESGLIYKNDIKFGRNYSRYRVKAGDLAGSKVKNGYWVVDFENKGISVHRVVMCLNLKRDLLPEEIIDHIDGNRSNNKISNLRIVTQSENNVNRKYCNLKSEQGVIFEGGKFPRWKAAWNNNFKRFSKSFSIKSYMKNYNVDFDQASNLAKADAIEYRRKMICQIYGEDFLPNR